ncbi:uncharacterized protein LOC143036690 [Oratosquilla oratoria]|uniref:uncharacterized protein LOC143036690 n=1 Tax=Oratosquilla oratoria TaxID=337810 RepID=UPI003F758BC3
MLNWISALLAIFVVQQNSCMPMSIEGMVSPSEDTRSIPIQTPVIFDDLPPVTEIDKTLPVTFVDENTSIEPFSAFKSKPNVHSTDESNQRPFVQSESKQTQPNIAISFPTTPPEKKLPVLPTIEENSGSGDGDVVFPDLRENSESTANDFILNLLNDNSTECDIDIGFVPFNGSCERLLARGSCAAGEWLVYEGDRFQCQIRPCPWKQVLFDGVCVNVSSFDVCPRGHILYVDLSGEASCDCQHGYVYGPRSGECYAQYTQGPCNLGHYVVIDPIFGSVKCVPNPCDLDGWLHHEPSNKCYLKLYDGFCNQKALWFNEVNRTVSCKDVLPFNIFHTPKLNSCPPGSLRDFVQKCRAYLPRIPVSSTYPTAKIGACPPGYTRDPLGTCKKVFSLFA